MAEKTRRLWIGANWKCNGDINSIKKLVDSYNSVDFNEAKCDVVVFPPALYAITASQLLNLDKFQLGFQNVSRPHNGAFTGEHSMQMLDDVGVTWVLIGHSERRQLYGETDKDVSDKVAMVQNSGLQSVVCVGETLEQREAGQLEEVISRQIDAFVPIVSFWEKVVIAYEPVWAIGTGKVATVEQAQQAHQFIRRHLEFTVGEAASAVRIVYGGSVSADNCKELIACPDVDGFLVGGASLKPAFGDIVKSAQY